KMVVDDPALATLAGVAPATTPDETRGTFYNLMQVSLFEIAWFSHERGQLPDDYFASWVENMVGVTRRSAFRAMWEGDGTKILHAGSRHYMETLIDDASVSALVPPDGTPEERSGAS